jgi:hypothetical protein
MKQKGSGESSFCEQKAAEKRCDGCAAGGFGVVLGMVPTIFDRDR